MSNVLIGIMILLLFNTLGEVVSLYVAPVLPGSVIGMILLFVALQLKIVKEQSIEAVVKVIMKNLPILFVAPAVSIVALFETIGGDIWGVLVALFISTVAVIVAVGVSLNLMSKDERDSN